MLKVDLDLGDLSVLQERHVVRQPGQLLLVGDRGQRGGPCKRPTRSPSDTGAQLCRNQTTQASQWPGRF